MADYLSVQSSPLGTLKYVESSATATVTADFLGPGTTVFSVKIDCTANTGEAEHSGYAYGWHDGTDVDFPLSCGRCHGVFLA